MAITTPTADSPQMGDSCPLTCSRLLDYERLLNAAEISKAILTMEGESVLIRNAFRWKKDGMVVSNAYECHGMEEVCEERGWKIVAKYGEHIAIITDNIPALAQPGETPKTKQCSKCPREMVRHNAEYNCLCGYGEIIPENS